MNLAFDLDGVLLDTRRANLEAYRACGVEPPENFHQVMWHTWTDVFLHSEKNRVLPRYMAAHAQRLPLWYMLEVQPRTNQLHVLSSCSQEAFICMNALFGIRRRVNNVDIGLDQDAKVLALAGMEPGIYFDDSAAVCRLVAKNTDWQVCHVTQRS